MQIHEIHSLFLQCNGISIDTRKITPNCFFVAIKGERYDANAFAQEALEKGALYVIIDNKDFYVNEKTILVDDSLTAIQQLAKHHRDYLNIPIVALTGSNGKTTTKELINCVLKQKFNTRATIGNLNNHIGVPLTLLSFTDETEIGIVEMGANHQKEIEFLCDIATPDFGYITNFGKAHLEGFGGIEGVIKGKSEMYAYLKKNNKTAFVNLDDSIQNQKASGIRTISFGLHAKDAFVQIDEITANPFVIIQFNGIKVNSNLIGLYNANNINAAITIGKYFGIEENEIKGAIESYIPENNRSQLIQKSGNEIILDAYNANPSSMKAAIENFIQLEKNNKTVFLGDMFELGPESPEEHRNIISLLSDQGNIKSYFIGKDFFAHKTESDHLAFFEDFESLSSYLKTQKIKNNAILIKGSRGMALERTLDFI